MWKSFSTKFGDLAITSEVKEAEVESDDSDASDNDIYLSIKSKP